MPRSAAHSALHKTAIALAVLVLHGGIAYALSQAQGVAVPQMAKPLAVRYIAAPVAKPVVAPRPKPEAPKPKPPEAPPIKRPPRPAPLLASKAESAAPIPAAKPPAKPLPVASRPAAKPAPAPVTAARSDLEYLANPAPGYPALSRRLGEAGRVLLRVAVAASGDVGEVSLEQSSGFARLDQAALRAVRRWRFEPARQAGSAVASHALVPIEFELRKKS